MTNSVQDLRMNQLVGINVQAHNRVLELAQKAGFKAGNDADLNKMVFPFDANHIAIRKYQHLGEGIDFEEVERIRAALKEAIEIIASKPVDDSPAPVDVAVRQQVLGR